MKTARVRRRITEPCPRCGEPKGQRAQHCRACCARMKSGAGHWNWRGDAASPTAARQRTQKAYPLGPCVQCGRPGTDRHHIDGHTVNNIPENIRILCRRCHMLEDGRLAAFPRSADATRRGPHRTHCHNGHLYTAENTVQWGNGTRRCRICVLARQERRRLSCGERVAL